MTHKIEIISRAALCAFGVGSLLLAVGSALGKDTDDSSKMRAQDRAAVAACLKMAADGAKQHASQTLDASSPTGDKVDAAAWMAAKAAKPPTPDRASCIGVVSVPCLNVPDNFSTVAMADCLRREHAVWDERLNAAYKVWTGKCDSAAICEGRRKLERAWLAYRDALCALPALEAQGGTIAIIEGSDCMLDETARQAIWIEERAAADDK